MKRKSFLLALHDGCLVIIALMAAYLFRFDFDLLYKINSHHAMYICSLSIVTYMSMFFIFSMQRIIWRYASIRDMIQLSKSVASGYVLVSLSSALIFGIHYIPFSILPLQAIFYVCLLVASRTFYRFLQFSSVDNLESKKVLIIGAGQAADGVLRDMLQHAERGYVPIGLLDDDSTLQKRSLRGVPVLGKLKECDSYICSLSPDMVVFAIPSLRNNNLLNRVYNICEKSKTPLRVLPGLAHITQGRVSIDALKKVEIEDLLGREPVSIVKQDLIHFLKDKVVLVTGAGGSIGSELCYQIAMNRPKALSLVDNCEYNLYACHAELTKKFPALEISISLTDISRQDEIESWFRQIKPHVVFHAAAYKHVPMLETQVFKAVKNNVFATQFVCDLADKYAAESFILVSTDKAVNPTNIMGMTKRLGEIYCQTKNISSKTNFITVRFGNVLGSNGSVLPLFRKQLAAGGPITVTHPDMTRYFMMIPEAVTLIMQSFLLGRGGEVFVLEMGDPVKIVELAEKLISLSGQKPYKDIDIQFTGIRPGEKLFEEVFHDKELLRKTSHQKILISDTRKYSIQHIRDLYRKLYTYYSKDDLTNILFSMMCLVPEYSGPYSSDVSINTIKRDVAITS